MTPEERAAARAERTEHKARVCVMQIEDWCADEKNPFVAVTEMLRLMGLKRETTYHLCGVEPIHDARERGYARRWKRRPDRVAACVDKLFELALEGKQWALEDVLKQAGVLTERPKVLRLEIADERDIRDLAVRLGQDPDEFLRLYRTAEKLITDGGEKR